MFSNIRNAIDNATEDVSRRFARRRQRQRGNESTRQTRTRQQQPQQAPPGPPQQAPPATAKAIKQLPTILVSPEDLIDPANRECCVCLDDNKLDDKVTRLPCAHIFHTCCIVDWLSNHSCTCPVCRYELPTNDPQYESGRVQRMKLRKPRYAMHELKRMRISDLLVLNRRPISGVLEKEDLIRHLINEGRIDVIPSPEPVEYKFEVLSNMKIGELKRTMAEAGVFFRREDVLMKSDMISIFENSGRLVLIRSESDKYFNPLKNYETAIDVKKDVYEFKSMKLSGGSNVEMRSTDSEGDIIVVETVKEDSSYLKEGSLTHEIMDEDIMDMFPNRSEEKTEERIEYENSTNSTRVTESMSNTQVPLSRIHTGHDLDDPSYMSSDSDTRNSVIEETPPRQHVATENMVIEEEVSDTDINQNDSALESEINIHSGEPNSIQTVIHDEQSSVTSNLLHTNVDMRSTFQHYTINHLQTLARDLQIDLSNCLEREEMIDTLVNTGITGSEDPSTLSPLMFSTWSVSQLRVVASESKVDLSDCTSKDEMIKCILHAGNLERLYLRDYLRSLTPLTTKSLSDLRAIARELQINISDCLEKDEIIRRLITRDRRIGTY